jgi:hypothetical protein
MTAADRHDELRAHEDSARALSPEAAGLVETYLARVHGAMLLTAAGEAEENVAELREHVLEELESGDGSPASVTRVLAELGSPEALARAYGEGVEHDTTYGSPTAVVPSEAGTGRDDEDLEGSGSILAGRVLGIPYDFRPPTARRIAHRWWNLLDGRVLVPRVWGAGWDVNLGAVAVSLGIVRPDDEDVPFGAVPDRALHAAFAVPAAIFVALVAMIALTYGRLPATVPMGWSLTFQPNQYWDTRLAAAFVLVMAFVPVAIAGWLDVSRRSNLGRAVAPAVASLLAMISLASWTMAAFGGAHGLSGWPMGLGITAALVVPFAILATLSRIGRDAEMRRDLTQEKKERAR